VSITLIDTDLTADETPTGRERLIAVTADQDLDAALREHWGDRYLRIDPSSGWPDRLARSSTDAILLDPRVTGLGQLRFRDLSGASTVYVLRRRSRPAGVPRVRRDVLRGRLRAAGEKSVLGGGVAAADAYTVVRPRVPAARRWYSAEDGPGGFIDRLRGSGARFVVLRWYDDLPRLPDGEDLDLLVLDSDIPLVEQVLGERPGTEPCDVYSVSGLPGTDFHAMAYLPPAFAQRIVARSEMLRGRFPVPSAYDSFLALAYHVAYHKGAASGLPISKGAVPGAGTVDHDYLAVLAEQAERAGLPAPQSLTEIDQLLDEHGVRPPRDMLQRLAEVNPWAGELAAASRGHAPAGLAVFFIREQAVAAGAADSIVARIQAEGFTVLRRKRLDAAAVRRVVREVRGGNWERGPYPISGGPPGEIVVAVDVMPAAVDARTAAAWPALDNARLLIKHTLRDEFNAGRSRDQQCNVLHSSDNADEALDYLLAALPREHDSLVTQAQRLVADYAPSGASVRDLSKNSRRARVELIEDGAGYSVRKHFRPGCERFLERERYVGGQLAPACDHLVPVVSSERDAVVSAYHENVLRFDRRAPRLLPLDVVQQAMAAARFLFDRGVALIDFTPGNLIVTPTGHVFVIDYEFAHRYRERPATFAESYDIAGPPPDFDGDLPVDVYGLGYDQAWLPYVGLTFEQLDAPRWRQHLLRARYRLTTTWPRLMGDWVGLSQRRFERVRGRAFVRIRRLATLFKHG
jgi:hypothetical protein